MNCGDAQAAGHAMAEILLDEELRAEMGGVMRERVMTTYNKTNIDQRYIDLYNEWLSPDDLETGIDDAARSSVCETPQG